MAIVEYNDEYFMRKALQEANLAMSEGEVPIGCVLVCKDKIIASEHNRTQQLDDVTAHAEILSICSAEQALQSKYLKDCTLYVTLEPCVMCSGAIFWAQIPKVVYGAKDPKRGSSLYGNLYHPKTIVEQGVLEKECSELIKDFFRNKR